MSLNAGWRGGKAAARRARHREVPLESLFVEGDGKSCAFAGFAADGDVAALLLDDRVGHSQADSDAVIAGIAAFVEAVKNIGQIFGGDAFSVIGNRQPIVDRIGFPRDVDTALFRRVFDAVF